MKPWIKLESTLLRDTRIQHLLNDHGFCGLGIYIAIRTSIMAVGDEGLPLAQVLTIGMPYTRKRKVQSIIEGYDLFWVEPTGIVFSRPLSPAHISGHRPEQEPKEKKIEENTTKFFKGRPLPPDAPPPPSASAEWDESSGTWFELYR